MEHADWQYAIMGPISWSKLMDRIVDVTLEVSYLFFYRFSPLLPRCMLKSCLSCNCHKMYWIYMHGGTSVEIYTSLSRPNGPWLELPLLK